jgi:hypothetical protein
MQTDVYGESTLRKARGPIIALTWSVSRSEYSIAVAAPEKTWALRASGERSIDSTKRERELYQRRSIDRSIDPPTDRSYHGESVVFHRD